MNCDTCLYSANETGRQGNLIWCALLGRMVDDGGCGQYRKRN
ncbi:MAG: hypothetical protein AAB307_00300 [Deltaproteobacteria bacterium]